MPTSSTALTASGAERRPCSPVDSRAWRTMFSTTTMASSTRMPIEKIEGEQRDAVERVAVEVEDEQRQRQRHRDGHQHDGGLAAAEREPDQDADRDDREEHVPEQFVRLVRGGLAVVARDGHLRGRRARRRRGRCRAWREIRRVRSMALTPLRFAIEIVTAGYVRPSGVWWATYDVGSRVLVADGGDVAQPHRSPAPRVDDDAFEARDAVDPGAGLDDLAAAAARRSRRRAGAGWRPGWRAARRAGRCRTTRGGPGRSRR